MQLYGICMFNLYSHSVSGTEQCHVYRCLCSYGERLGFLCGDLNSVWDSVCVCSILCFVSYSTVLLRSLLLVSRGLQLGPIDVVRHCVEEGLYRVYSTVLVQCMINNYNYYVLH